MRSDFHLTKCNLLCTPVRIFHLWFCLHLPCIPILENYLPWYLIMIDLNHTLNFFADVFITQGCDHTFMHVCQSVCVGLITTPQPVPTRSQRVAFLRRPSAEEEVPSINTKCFESVQTDNTECLNNPWVFPGKPLSCWCNKMRIYCRFYTL